MTTGRINQVTVTNSLASATRELTRGKLIAIK